jgi:nicotinamidase/pyrazinamidase
MTHALVVVDMQVDFGLPTGSLYVSGAEEILGPINELVRSWDGPVVFTADSHPADTPHFETWPVHCVAGTPGAAFLPGLDVTGPVVEKGTDGQDGYSGFSVRAPDGSVTRTVLEGLLREQGVDEVTVVGLAGDYCVGETALDAVDLGFRTTMPLALTRFVNVQPGDDDRMVARLEAAGVQVTRRAGAARPPG